MANNHERFTLSPGKSFSALHSSLVDRSVISSIALRLASCLQLAAAHDIRGAIGDLTILVTRTGSVIVQMADFSLHLSVGPSGAPVTMSLKSSGFLSRFWLLEPN